MYTITITDKTYPESLKNIYDPPQILYVKGQFLPQDHFAIAIVGTREPSHYGRQMAENLSRDLAQRGFTIVSGFARGIDTCAHVGALKAKGRTIAVLGCGIDIVYPAENKKLMERIEENGAVVSEFPLSTPPLSFNFPRRNRLISGLSLGVIVVEAKQKSGSLITASLAAEQGREVFSVPGRADSLNSKGTHALIRDGAKLVENVDDVLTELQPAIDNFTAQGAQAPAINLSENQRLIFDALGSQPVSMDDICQVCSLAVPEVTDILMQLEIKGVIKRLPGNFFIKSN